MGESIGVILLSKIIIHNHYICYKVIFYRFMIDFF